MPHVVISALGHVARLNVSFELARRLRECGHKVTYICPEIARRQVVAQGHSFVGLSWNGFAYSDPDHVALNALRFRHKLLRPRYCLGARARIRQRFLENCNEIVKALESTQPDLILVDFEMHALIIASAYLAIPTVLFSDMFCVWKRAGMPLLDDDCIPDNRLNSRIRHECSWLCRRTQRFLTDIRRALLSLGTNQRALLKHLARHVNFSLRHETNSRQWLVPFTYTQLPVLVTHTLKMEFPHVPANNVFYIGPMVAVDRTESLMDPKSDAVVNRILAQHDVDNGARRPLVYCALSSFLGVDRDFFHNVINAFRIRSDWDLIIGMGGMKAPADIGHVPPNIHILNWAPQLTILKHADCAITRAAPGTLNECIQFGVPMVAYSTKTMDQNGTAARIAFHRVGIRADKDADKAIDIVNHVQSLLTDPVYRANIAAMQRHYTSYAKSDDPVRLIESFMETPL